MKPITLTQAVKPGSFAILLKDPDGKLGKEMKEAGIVLIKSRRRKRRK